MKDPEQEDHNVETSHDQIVNPPSSIFNQKEERYREDYSCQGDLKEVLVNRITVTQSASQYYLIGEEKEIPRLVKFVYPVLFVSDTSRAISKASFVYKNTPKAIPLLFRFLSLQSRDSEM